MNASIYFFLSHEGIFNGQKVCKLQIISNDAHKDKYRILVQMIKSLLVRAGQLSTKAFLEEPNAQNKDLAGLISIFYRLGQKS